MKIFLWITLLAGLLPVTAYSVLHVLIRGSVRNTTPVELAEEQSSDSIVMASVHFGEAGTPTIVNPSMWPAILVLTGATLCIVGLFNLIPKQPLRVARDGYTRFEPLIQKVLESRRDYSSLIVSAQQGSKALSVSRRQEEFLLGVSIDSSDPAIPSIVEFFLSRGVSPSSENVSHDDHFDISTTHLEFPLPQAADAAAETCTHVYRDILGVAETEPMEFSLRN